MNILIVSFYFKPEIGAAPSRITNLAYGMSRSGAHVDVLTCLPNYPKGRTFEGYRHKFSVRENIDGIDVFRYWAYVTMSKGKLRRILSMFSFSFNMLFFMFRIRRIRQYDKVFIQSPPILVPVSAILLFKKLYRRDIILNVSDLWPQSAVELGYMKRDSITYRITCVMERFIYRNSDIICGQSQEILDHIRTMAPKKTFFLYRNLPQHDSRLTMGTSHQLPDNGKVRIVYAGLLGIAQDMLSLIRAVNFASLNAELHLYGGGVQTDEIASLISEEDNGVFYHGILPKEQMDKVMDEYDMSLVVLAKPIKGAVPSKIFDILPHGIPILFCGEGEGARLVEESGFGLVSPHSDFEALKANIRTFLSDKELYRQCSDNCISASKGKFDFDMQLQNFMTEINI